MKSFRILCVCLFVFALATPAFAKKQDFDEAHRFLFFAVLEGCYNDGLSTGDVAQILLRREKESYFHFIYACPICTPTIQALEAYQSRPAVFYSQKSGASTFGAGLDPDIRQALYSDSPEDRLAAINALIQDWIKKRFTEMALTEEQRTQLEKALEDKRKEGMKTLKQFKIKSDDAENNDPGVTFYAPAFATIEECAACNAAVGKGLTLPKPE